NVGGRRDLLLELRMRRQELVDELDEGVAQPGTERRLVERLQLDEQLVDDTGDAFTLGAAHTRTRPADSVDLLNEADGAALLAGGDAQGLEERADLAVGLAVVHRLEG